MSNPYEIAIRLSAENSVTPVLASLAKDMLGLEMSAGRLEKAFANMGTGMKAALGAGVIVGAGVAAVEVVNRIAEANEKLRHQQSVMLRNGQQYNEVMGLTADAYDRITSIVPTAAASDVLRTITELRTVLGDTNAAVAQAPFALKLDAIISNLTGRDSEGAGFSLWRALEMKGLTVSDPAGASKLAETMAEVISASAGKVTADSYQAFAKRGGAAWMAASPHFISGAGSVLIGDMGGDTAGTALSTLYGGLMGGTQMSRQQIDAYRTAGLLDESKIHKIKGSSNVQMDPGAIKGVADHAGDLDVWVADTLAPAFRAAAEKMSNDSGGTLTAGAAYDSLVAKAGRNKNTTRLLHMFGDPEFIQQINKDRDIWSMAQGLDPAYGSMIGDSTMNKPRGPSGRISEAGDAANGAANAAKTADYGAVMKALQAQWESLMQAVGGPAATAMIGPMKALTDELNQLAASTNKDGSSITKIVNDITGLMSGLASIAVPIAKVAGDIANTLNSITAAENQFGEKMHAFWKRLGIDWGESGAKSYDPLSSIRPHPALKTTPSGIALSGGADNAKLAAASAMPVNLPPANVSATLQGPAHVTTGPISLTVSGQSIVAALASEITAKIEGLFRGLGASGTNSDSGHDGRASPVYPDHMHGSH